MDQYEQYENERAQRAKKRRKRRRRQRVISTIMLLIVVAVIGVGIFYGTQHGLFTDAWEKVQLEYHYLKDKYEHRNDPEPETSVVVVETEPVTERVTEAKVDETVLAEADKLAAMYDYDGAIALLNEQPNASGEKIQGLIADYQTKKDACVEILPENVTHIFYHSLVADPSKAFIPGEPGYDGWQQWMTTIYEWDKITQSMYDRGYVLVSIHDLINKTVAEDGTVTIEPKSVWLPEGKKAYVMSLDDLSYYHTYDNHGVASRLVVGDDGKPTCEYIQDDGTVVTGDYDVVPRMDSFIEEHPDACYKGARGIIALTGYNGVLGYRTDGTYDDAHNENSDVYFADKEQLEWLEAHPDYNFETEVANAKKVADAMKAEGWEFASHTWGHKKVGEATYDEIVRDTERWLKYISPIVGEVDTIIFAHGEDITSMDKYTSNDKYIYLKKKGFDLFCNVDSVDYTTYMTLDFFHQGRRNLDGYRIYRDYVSTPQAGDLFNAKEVLDPDRPIPVPNLDGSLTYPDEEMDSDDGGSGDEEYYDDSEGYYDESGEYIEVYDEEYYG